FLTSTKWLRSAPSSWISIEIRLARERELEVLALGKMVGRFLPLTLKGEKRECDHGAAEHCGPKVTSTPFGLPGGEPQKQADGYHRHTAIVADVTEMPGTLTRPNTDSPAATTKTATPIDGQLNRCRRRVGPPRLGASCPPGSGFSFPSVSLMAACLA